MILAGDNLLDFSLKGFVDYFNQKEHTCVMRHFEADDAKLKRTGVAEIDAEDRIISMEEKPQEPKSNWAIPPFYIYKKEDLVRIKEGLEDGCSADAPGGFITWLCQKSPVYAYEMLGKRYDIGSLESYEKAKQNYV